MVSRRTCDSPFEEIVFSPISVENIHPCGAAVGTGGGPLVVLLVLVTVVMLLLQTWSEEGRAVPWWVSRVVGLARNFF